MWAEHYQALWNGQLHRLVCSNDDHSVSRFVINPYTLYFSIIMIKFYLHMINLSYYKALEHTMDCIGNKKKCVYVCVCVCVYNIYIYIYIYINKQCIRNSELITNKNNILLKVIDTNFSMSQFTMVLNFFYIVSLFVYNVF